MATVRLYVALAVLLMATCFHTTEGGWLRRRRRRGSSCNRVNCQWSSWSSWSTCTYCSKYKMQERTRRQIRSSLCGGSSCSGYKTDIRVCTDSSYRHCSASSVARNVPAFDIGKLPRRPNRDNHERYIHERYIHERYIHERYIHERYIHERYIHERYIHERYIHERYIHERYIHERYIHERYIHERYIHETQ
ncbi:hypothetical protein LSAT2_007020 [Lamellibrachia satsuma]|nr:hypothetical protein LSAT2_007020 [Lamellibrachia satsuma]